MYAQELYNNYFNTFGSVNEANEIVSIDRGSKLSAVFTAINGIAQDVAKLPIDVCKDSRAGGKDKYRNHYVYKLINQAPNEYMGAFNFWYTMIFNALREGSTALIIRENGIPTQLIPFQYDSIGRSKDGSVFYSYKGQQIPDRDVLSLKMYTFDGITPVSPITWNAELMGYRMKVRKYASKVIGTNGNGFISSEGISQEDGQIIAKNMKEAIAKGEIPFMGSSGKTTWNRQLITPEEGQYLETAKKGDRDIFAIYRYPNALGGDLENGTYSNTEQQDLVYAKYTLTPWARLIEDEINRKLFTEANKVAQYPYYSLYDFRAMLKGDLNSRKEYYQVMKDGIMSADEIREMEGLPPLPEGKGKYVYTQGANKKLGEEEVVEPIKNDNEDE